MTAPARPSAASPYSDVIRRRWRSPSFRGSVPGANAVAEDVNPLCGDRVRMELRVDGGAVAEARFAGDSCAICTASADALAERVSGRPVSEAVSIDTGALLDILDADVRPTRMRCVTLPISVLRQALGVSGAAR